MGKCLRSLLNPPLFPPGLNGNSKAKFPRLWIQARLHFVTYNLWCSLSHSVLVLKKQKKNNPKKTCDQMAWCKHWDTPNNIRRIVSLYNFSLGLMELDWVCLTVCGQYTTTACLICYDASFSRCGRISATYTVIFLCYQELLCVRPATKDHVCHFLSWF